MDSKQIQLAIKLLVCCGMLLALQLPCDVVSASPVWQKDVQDVARPDGVADDKSTDDAVKPLEGEARQQAALLVRDLANPDFEVRQQASRELWKIGPPALELLQAAIDGGTSSEAQMRSKDLVTLIKTGVEHDADADVVHCIVGFLDREELVQDRAIKKLVHLNQVEVALKLIELVPSKTSQKRMREFCSMGAGEAELALRLGEDEKFEEWINDPATRESQKLLYYYHLWMEDDLDSAMTELRVEADVEIKKGIAHRAKLKKEKPKRNQKRSPPKRKRTKKRRMKASINPSSTR